jgi:hypothetical protein
MKANTFCSLLARFGSEIISCLNCMPYEDGEPVWIAQPTCLDDLFDSEQVPAIMRRRLAERLRCRNCRSRLEQYDIVGIEFTRNRLVSVRLRKTLRAA